MTGTKLGDDTDRRRSLQGRRIGETSLRRKALALAAFLILAATTLNAFFGEGGFLSLMKTKSEYEALAVEVQTLEIETLRLADRILGLRTDPMLIERQAREVLGMAKEGEIVVTIRTPRER